MLYQACLLSSPCLPVTVAVARKRQELATAHIFGGGPPPGMAPEEFHLSAAASQKPGFKGKAEICPRPVHSVSGGDCRGGAQKAMTA